MNRFLLVVWNDITYSKIESIMTISKNENSLKIQQIMQDNPDLSCEFVRQLLIAQAEIDAGKVVPFEFG